MIWRAGRVIVVHHGTKDGLTYRGSSVIAANVDGAIEVSKEGLILTLSCPLGMKDAAEFATFKVRLEQIPVETEDGFESVPVVKDRLDWLDMTFEQLGRNEELAFSVLTTVPAGLTWSDWFKATKTAAHGGKLGSSNFSDIVRRLFKAGRIKGGGKRGAVFQVVAGQVASSSTNAPPNTPHSRVKDPGVRSDSSGSVQNLSHFRLAERHPALAHAVMAPLICWSFSNSEITQPSRRVPPITHNAARPNNILIPTSNPSDHSAVRAKREYVLA
jgi:hypothetical protein